MHWRLKATFMYLSGYFEYKAFINQPDPLYSGELSVHTVFTRFLPAVQCKLHTALLNSTLLYSLANLGLARQQTQLVRCYKSAKQEYEYINNFFFTYSNVSRDLRNVT